MDAQTEERRLSARSTNTRYDCLNKATGLLKINVLLAIQREEEKVKRSLKEAAKKGDKDTSTILAKEIIRARKAISKIYTSKAHLNSVQLQMKNQLGMSFKLTRRQ